MESLSFEWMKAGRRMAFVAMIAVATGIGTTPAAAQEVRATLLGRVVDLTSNTVVAGADVILVDTERRATTDDSGSFVFAGLAPGTYIVEVRQPGYEQHTDEITVAAGERLEVRFSIGVEAIPLEPITVVARSRSVETDAADLGRRFDGMNRTEIEAVLGRVFTMADLLREARTPGVSVVNMTTWVCAEHGRVTRRRRDVNGTDSCRPMAVYIDGVRAMNPGEMLMDVVPETVERFEILGPMQGAVLYGQDAESGIIVIETQRGGRRLGEPLIIYSHDQPVWVFTFGAVGTNPTFTHNGLVVLNFPGGNLSSFYEERSEWRAGVRASVARRFFGYHRFRLSAYQVFGSSTGRYSSIRTATTPPTIHTRGHRSGGLDFTYQPRIKASEKFDLRMDFGPTVSWQRIRLSQGHNNEWAAPTATVNPDISWHDRTWTSFGAMVGMELTRFVNPNWAWFVGARVRALYYGDMESWEIQNIEDIVQQTGNVVFPDYHQPLALHPAFSVGVSWRKGQPLGR